MTFCIRPRQPLLLLLFAHGAVSCHEWEQAYLCIYKWHMFRAQFKTRASPASEIAFFVGSPGFDRLENLLALWLPYQKGCGDPALNNLLPQIHLCHTVNIIRAIVDDALHKISEIGINESSLWCYCAKSLNSLSEIAGGVLCRRLQLVV